MKTPTGAYIKKDKDHDIFDNPINPEKIDIPDEIINQVIIELDGRKFFWVRDKVSLQCSKCLNAMSVLAHPDEGKLIRRLYMVNDCACTRNKND